MKLSKVIACYSIFAGFLACNFQPLCAQKLELDQIIQSVQNSRSANEREIWMKELRAYNGPFPFVKDDKAVFFYQGKADSVSIAGDMNGWEPGSEDKMIQIQNTEYWYLKKHFDPAASIDYKLVINGNQWILDPQNPNKSLGGFGYNSNLIMPLYKPKTDHIIEGIINVGRIIDDEIESTNVDSTYTYHVYLPFQYSKNNDYPIIYFHDGQDYIELGKAKNILDNLISKGEIPPTIGVFIDPTARYSEYGGDLREQYSKFIIDELIPAIEQTFLDQNTIPTRIMIGTSMGANITTLISYNHPEIISRIGLHSPALRFNDFEALKLVENSNNSPTKIFTVIGTYEGLTPEQCLALVESFSDESGEINYIIAPQGHNWPLWVDTLGDMLRYLLN